MPKKINQEDEKVQPGETGTITGALNLLGNSGNTAKAESQQKETPAESSVKTYTTGGGNQKYIDQLNDIYGQITSRQPFSYDLNGDMLYRQMADQYTRMGKQAMQDTMGKAAALTGGYGNSYAQTVGNQAYQQYLASLNDQVPALYKQAYNVWNGEGDRLLQIYKLAAAHPEYLEALSPKTYTVSGKKTDTKGSTSYQDLLSAIGLETTGALTGENSSLTGTQEPTAQNALNKWFYTLLKNKTNSTGK